MINNLSLKQPNLRKLPVAAQFLHLRWTSDHFMIFSYALTLFAHLKFRILRI